MQGQSSLYSGRLHQLSKTVIVIILVVTKSEVETKSMWVYDSCFDIIKRNEMQMKSRVLKKTLLTG